MATTLPYSVYIVVYTQLQYTVTYTSCDGYFPECIYKYFNRATVYAVCINVQYKLCRFTYICIRIIMSTVKLQETIAIKSLGNVEMGHPLGTYVATMYGTYVSKYVCSCKFSVTIMG